jgi:hypothetical protein
MRFMMLMIPKGYEKAEPGAMPDPQALAAMLKYNETLQKAGVLLALDGLHPPSVGARVSFSGGKPMVSDGPFAEAKEVIGGYAILEAPSMDEAVHVTRRFLEVHGDGWEIDCEIRQMERHPDVSAA